MLNRTCGSRWGALVRAGVMGLGIAAGVLAMGGRAQAQPCVNTNIAGAYSGAAIVPGVDDLGIHCDDCTTTIALPFPIRLYGRYYSQAVISSNGNIQFGTNNINFTAECLPTREFQTAIFPYWDDLTLYTPGDGVFAAETGVAPNREYTLEWRAHYFNRAGTANFQVRFFENSRNFEFIYGANNGTPYTIGVQKDGGELHRYVTCNFSSDQPVGRRYVWSESHTGSYGGLSGQRTYPVGVTDIGNQCDDCTTAITFPFPVTFYHQTYTTANVSSNGNIQFATANTTFTNGCLPIGFMGPALMAHWDDLRTDFVAGQGIFVATNGDAPYRTFDVEWRARLFATDQPINFAVRFFEGLEYYELYYGAVPGGAGSATIGAQAGDERYSESWCNGRGSVLAPNSIVTLSFPPAMVYSPSSSSVAGVTDIGNHCDDCTTNITLPFPVNLYGTSFTSANVSSNGNIQFESDDAAYFNSCPPVGFFGTTIFAHWDDLRTDAPGSGIFTTTFGNAPNRLFAIQWRATYFATGHTAEFSAVLYEETQRFELYLGGLAERGVSATVGVQNTDGSLLTDYSCNAAGRVPAWVSFSCLLPDCVADVDDGSFTGTPDGGVTIDDLLFYLFIFENGDIRADVDDGSFTGVPDGGVTIDDLLYYLFRFESGC